MNKEEKQTYIRKHSELEQKIKDLSEEELHKIFDMGCYNDTIRGYVLEAMKFAGFNAAEVNRAINGLSTALDFVSASEATRAWRSRR